MAAAIDRKQRDVPTGWLDRLGIGVSAFCLLQCLALPVALVLAPAASVGFFSHEAFHLLLLAVIIPLSLLAFGFGFARHRNPRMWVPAGTGVTILVLAALFEQAHVLSAIWNALLTSAGSAFLIVGHFLNLRCSPRRT